MLYNATMSQVKFCIISTYVYKYIYTAYSFFSLYIQQRKLIKINYFKRVTIIIHTFTELKSLKTKL